MSVLTRARFLAVFGGLFPRTEWSPARLDPLLDSIRVEELEAGRAILREGQVCAAAPFVLEGSIRVFKTAESGREISLYRIGPGELCILSAGCESSLGSFPASVAVERPTVAAFAPKETLRALLDAGPTFRSFVLDQYARRMAEVFELVEEVAFRRLDERLAARLRELASRDARVEATHQELADRLGSSREVVSRILKDWEERGGLELSRGSLRLLPSFGEVVGDRPR